MTRVKDWPLVAAIASLLVSLLVCICLLALPAKNNNDTSQVAVEVARQEYKRELAELDRKYEIRVNRLQEELNSLQFVTTKRIELMDDDLMRHKREIDDLRERIKARR